MSDPNFDDAWNEPPRPAPRGRGRPPLNKKAVRQEELDDAPNPAEDLPLFAEVGETIVKIRVMRVEPNEGFLEDIHDPELTLAEIERRFGGGTFQVQAINERHKIVKTTRIKIAGDPIFKTPSLQAQWERQHGIKKESRQELSPIDMITFISEREAIRQEAEMKMQERLRQIQIEADARKRADEDERERRRRQDEDERDRRREQQRRDDEERNKANTQQMIAMLQAQHSQSMQFMQATMQMQAQQAQQLAANVAAKPAEGGLLEAIKTIAVIKETFAGDGGGGEKEQPEDLMALLVKNGPSWLNAAGNAIGGAVREIKGGVAPAVALPSTQTNILAALPEPIAKKMETFVEKLVEKGHDPTVAVNNVLDHLIANTEALPVRGQSSHAQQAQETAPEQPPRGLQAVDVQGQAKAMEPQQVAKVLPIKRNSIEVGAKADGVVSVKFTKTQKL